MSAFAELEMFEYIFVLILLLSCISPYISAYRGRTSIALATILSLMLASFVQFTVSAIQGVPVEAGWIVSIFGIRPSIASSPMESYRFITSAWIHAGWIHVLGNILVVGLVGIPLEQRMGGRRWMFVYLLGLLGGNLAWVLTHPDSSIPAIGASGAAFGILGAYMACWPSDEVEFPLLFLIRAWPVWLIVFIRLGIEIWQMYSIQTGTAGESNIAHMAHVGGFFLSYSLARRVTMGGPQPLERDVIEGVSSSKKNMPSMKNNPWEMSGKPLEGRAMRVLRKLLEEGDEMETRRAWLEELSEHTICPLCGGEILAVTKDDRTWIKCGVSESHLMWP